MTKKLCMVMRLQYYYNSFYDNEHCKHINIMYIHVKHSSLGERLKDFQRVLYNSIVRSNGGNGQEGERGRGRQKRVHGLPAHI